jgi:hypothetical protein
MSDVATAQARAHAPADAPAPSDRVTTDHVDPTQFSTAGAIPSVAASGGSAQAAASASERAFDGTLHDDRHDLDGAKHTLDALDRQLGMELDQIGPGLTPQQKVAYIRAFRARPDYRKGRQALVKSEHGLAAELHGQGGERLRRLADHGEENAAQALLDAYASLAISNKDGARAALLWAHATLRDPGFAHRAKLHDIQAHATDTYANGLLAELQHIIGSGHHANLVAQVNDACNRLGNEMQYMARVLAIGNLPSVLRQFAIEIRSPFGAREARRLLDALRGEAPMVRRVVAGLFTFGGVATYGGRAVGGEIEALTLMQVNARELMNSLRGSKTVAEIARKLGHFTGVARRVIDFMPLLGAVGSGRSGIDDVEALAHGAIDVTHIARTVGDFLQVVGFSLEVAPPPVDLIGTALMTIGGVISSLTLLWAGPSKELLDERDLLAKDLHFSHNQVAAFTGGYRRNDENTNASARNLAQAQYLGVSPRVIQQLADIAPDLFSREWSIQHMHYLYEFLRQPAQGGLKTDSFATFLELCSHNPGTFRSQVTTLVGLSFAPSGPWMNGLDYLVMSWHVLGREQFAHLPDDQYRKWAGASHEMWPHLLGA